MKVGMNTSRTYSQGPTLPKPDSRVAGNLSQKIVSVLGRLSGENGPSHVTFTRNYVTSSAKKPITSATSKYLNKLQYLLKLDLLGHLGTGRNDAFFKHRYVCHLHMYIHLNWKHLHFWWLQPYQHIRVLAAKAARAATAEAVRTLVFLHGNIRKRWIFFLPQS